MLLSGQKLKTKKATKSEVKVKKRGMKKKKTSRYGTAFPGFVENSKKWLSNDLDVLMGKAIVTKVHYIQLLPTDSLISFYKGKVIIKSYTFNF